MNEGQGTGREGEEGEIEGVVTRQREGGRRLWVGEVVCLGEQMGF